jgi:hypothetical protein
LHVFTIEECQNCKEKTKRDFKVGDYITAAAGTCAKCQGQKMIILVYGEKVLQRGEDKGRAGPQSGAPPSPTLSIHPHAHHDRRWK